MGEVSHLSLTSLISFFDDFSSQAFRFSVQADVSTRIKEDSPDSPRELYIVHNFEFEIQICLSRTTKIFVSVIFLYHDRIIGYI